jgi:hypothetical protein
MMLKLGINSTATGRTDLVSGSMVLFLFCVGYDVCFSKQLNFPEELASKSTRLIMAVSSYKPENND